MARRVERLLEIVEEYKEKNLKTPIVVEGRKDIRSLRKLGFSGKITAINTGQSLVSIIEKLTRRNDEIIVLTDFDRTGDVLKDKLVSYIQSQGKHADLYLWDYFHSIGFASSIEEVYGAVTKMVEKSMTKKTIQTDTASTKKRTQRLRRKYSQDKNN